MPTNRFYNYIPQNYNSMYVPYPIEDIQRAGMVKEEQLAQTESMYDKIPQAVSESIKAVSNPDKLKKNEILKGYNNQLDNIRQQFQDSDPGMALSSLKMLSSKINRDLQSNPEVVNINDNYPRFDAELKAADAMRLQYIQKGDANELGPYYFDTIMNHNSNAVPTGNPLNQTAFTTPINTNDYFIELASKLGKKEFENPNFKKQYLDKVPGNYTFVTTKTGTNLIYRNGEDVTHEVLADMAMNDPSYRQRAESLNSINPELYNRNSLFNEPATNAVKLVGYRNTTHDRFGGGSDWGDWDNRPDEQIPQQGQVDTENYNLQSVTGDPNMSVDKKINMMFGLEGDKLNATYDPEFNGGKGGYRRSGYDINLDSSEGNILSEKSGHPINTVLNDIMEHNTEFKKMYNGSNDPQKALEFLKEVVGKSSTSYAAGYSTVGWDRKKLNEMAGYGYTDQLKGQDFAGATLVPLTSPDNKLSTYETTTLHTNYKDDADIVKIIPRLTYTDHNDKKIKHAENALVVNIAGTKYAVLNSNSRIKQIAPHMSKAESSKQLSNFNKFIPTGAGDDRAITYISDGELNSAIAIPEYDENGKPNTLAHFQKYIDPSQNKDITKGLVEFTANMPNDEGGITPHKLLYDSNKKLVYALTDYDTRMKEYMLSDPTSNKLITKDKPTR